MTSLPARVLRWLLIGLALAGSAAQLQAKPVRLAISELRPPTEEVTVHIHLESVGADSKLGKLDTETFEIRPPGAETVELEIGSVWRIKAKADGWWAPAQIVTIEPETEEIRLGLLRTGTLKARLEPDAGSRLGRVSIRFQSSPSATTEVPSTLQPCSVTDSMLECEVPVGLIDLRLRAEGFISHYLWDLRIPGGGTHDLGRLRLRRGATVVGWVSAPDSSFDFADCSVELSPLAGGNVLDPTDSARRKNLVDVTSVNNRGFFELLNVQPGSYVVTLRHPDYAPTRYFPTWVLEAAETEILELAPSPPARIKVRVVPPRDPYQKPWDIDLAMEGASPGTFEKLADGRLAENGEWQRRDLEPGRYRLIIKDLHGNPWHRELRELVGDESFEIHLEAEQVEGRVLLGDEPIVAEVAFGGRRRVPSLTTTTDQNGEFELVVPRKDEWIIDVGSPSLNINRRFSGVEIESTGAEGTGQVELKIPDTLLEGVVVDEEGHPFADADVNVSGPAAATSTVSSPPAGEFSIRGLPTGEYRAQARTVDDEWLSDRVTTVLDEEPAQPLRLVLRRQVDVTGQIVSPEGHSVVNARVIGLIEQPDFQLSSFVPDAVTDVDGVFTFKVPGQTRGLQLNVFAPGYAVRQLRLELPNEGPIIVPLERIGGTLKVVLDLESPEQQRLSLFKDYLVANPGALFSWAKLNGVHETDPGTRIYPMLEPGRYHICFGLGWHVQLTGRLPVADAQDKCVAGELAPHGELELHLSMSP